MLKTEFLTKEFLFGKKVLKKNVTFAYLVAFICGGARGGG
jgi:hypothetical protein